MIGLQSNDSVQTQPSEVDNVFPHSETTGNDQSQVSAARREGGSQPHGAESRTSDSAESIPSESLDVISKDKDAHSLPEINEVRKEVLSGSNENRSSSSDEPKKNWETTKRTNVSIFDPEVHDIVHGTFKTLFTILPALIIAFPPMLCLFFGVGWSPKDNYSGVKVAVADLDHSIIGNTLIAVASKAAIPFTIEILPQDSLYDDIKRRVNIGEFNVALVAMQGASAALSAAMANVSAPYSGATATNLIFDEGRGGSGMVTLYRLAVSPLAAQATNLAVSQAMFRQVIETGGGGGSPATAVNGNPSALLSAVGVTEVNLHPVQFSGMNMAAGLATITHWILAMVAVSAVIGISLPLDAAGVRKDHQNILHAVAPGLLCLPLSFWPPAILRFFGADLSPGQYFEAFGFVYLGMLCYCGVVVTLFRWWGPVKGAGAHSAFLLLNFIASPALGAPETLYKPLLVGIALPIWNTVEGYRTLLFGSYNVMGRNCGVLAAWIGVALLALAVSVRRERRAVAARAATRATRAAPCAAHDVQVVVLDAVSGPSAADAMSAAAQVPAATVRNGD